MKRYEIDDVAVRMRERLAHRGEPLADVVIVQGDAKATLRLFGTLLFSKPRSRCHVKRCDPLDAELSQLEGVFV